jgi:hypothetical protein
MLLSVVYRGTENRFEPISCFEPRSCSLGDFLGQAMLLETAVEYIRYLQEQVEELRESCNSGHATQKVELG